MRLLSIATSLMNESPEILYVDDELNNLLSMKATFRLQYKIHTAINTDEAREILTRNPDIRVIFCDQRMPGETGVEFFASIKNDFPRPIRILLTAYADMETVIDAVNRGHIFRFVRKPWVEEELISSVEEANKFYLATSLLDIRNEELQCAYEELDKFAYSVGHDLRDPLVAIHSALRVSLKFNDVKRIHEVLGHMQTSISKLFVYINNLHDYYLHRRGGLNIGEVDIQALFDYFREFYSIHIENNGIQLDISVQQSEPFRTDEVALKLIIQNLLSNAFKYQRRDNPDKRVSLTATVVDQQISIGVKDNGIGIGEKDVGQVFNLFYRASDQVAGAGFGLYNVKGIVTKLGGKITVDSAPGEGTFFNVVLPGK